MSIGTSITVLNPTLSSRIDTLGMARRLKTIKNLKVGLLANDKINSEQLLDAIYDVLAERSDVGGASASTDNTSSTSPSTSTASTTAIFGTSLFDSSYFGD